MTRIFIPIAGNGLVALLAQADAARAQGADGVELRVDLCEGADPAPILQALPRFGQPTIVTIRHASEGGRWSGDEQERMRLLALADEAGAAYIDLELAHHRGWRPTKAHLILSYHDFAGMGPPDTQGSGGALQAIVDRMRHAGAAVAKIAVTARDAHDLAIIRALYQAADGPLVAIAMGEHGLASRLLAGIWGADFTFARLSGGGGTAPGQPTVEDLRRYRLRAQNPQTRIFGVIGSPIAHSLSPLIHNAAFATHGIDAVYVPFRVEDVRAFWASCADWIEGLSITIPHKQALLEEVDESEELVMSLRAINTIYRTDGGASVAANTDAGAIIRCLEVATGNLRGRRVLILGAGGVARTAAYACRSRGASVVLANRTAARATALAEELGCSDIAWDQAPSVDYQVLINGTSVGMGKPDESPWPAAAHRRGTVVFDTVYVPLETRLLRDAGAAGATTVCGLEMFIGQAVGQFERWTGLRAPEHLMYRLALERLDPAAAGTVRWKAKTTASGA